MSRPHDVARRQPDFIGAQGEQITSGGDGMEKHRRAFRAASLAERLLLADALRWREHARGSSAGWTVHALDDFASKVERIHAAEPLCRVFPQEIERRGGDG